MHSLLSRGNAVLAYTLSVLVTLTFACFLSTIMIDYRKEATLKTLKVEVKNLPEYGVGRKLNDLGHITFNVDADLSSIFNWNVKQLFVYITAEYETPANELNQVVLWDRIIKRGENADLHLKNIRTKYYFWDDGNGLKGNKNVTLTLSYNIVPNVGGLPLVGSIGSHSFSFPSQYS
ncbi:signal peptidase complex subunit 3 [Daktulosphaira vitifoliae]|uniref:Signal peptidase complex subunit 3 n=1 Tax=Daktulosphaira vitifoliae TaxID=58002 RepID=A0A481SW76_DAKVI|nr:signal peptidase complex subunit 3 [Daktulosphaira vitifoliae]QBH72889.1 microsomal signal peptidase 23 kd subunit [Daktulosphaira vitifoliae]